MSAQVGVYGRELDIEGGDVRVDLEVARVSMMKEKQIAGSCVASYTKSTHGGALGA